MNPREKLFLNAIVAIRQVAMVIKLNGPHSKVSRTIDNIEAEYSFSRSEGQANLRVYDNLAGDRKSIFSRQFEAKRNMEDPLNEAALELCYALVGQKSNAPR